MTQQILEAALLSLTANAVFVLVLLAGRCWIDGAPDSNVCRDWWKPR